MERRLSPSAPLICAVLTSVVTSRPASGGSAPPAGTNQLAATPRRAGSDPKWTLLMANWALMVAVTATAFGGSDQSRGNDVTAVESLGETTGDINRRLAEIEAKIERLEARRNKTYLSQERAAAIRNLTEEVLSDADTRASLFSDSVTGGYDGDFFLASADGNFRVAVSGQLQFRYVWNHRREREDKTRAGFETRRAKITLRGTVVSPQLRYSVTTSRDRRTGVFELQSLSLELPLGDQVRIRAGRFRSPLLREEAVSSRRQLIVERSLVAKRFDQPYLPGVSVRYRTDAFQVRAAFVNISDEIFGDQGWRAAARADLLLWGRWSSLRDFTSFPSDRPTAALGAGILMEDEDPIRPSDNDSRTLRWTADVSAEFGGANAFAAVVGNHPEEDREPSLDQFGVVVQGGLFFTEKWEAFARYEWGDADGEAADLSILTVGINRYFTGHDLKLTADVGYGLNEIDRFWSSSGAGWRRDSRDREGQVVMRFQLQLLF